MAGDQVIAVVGGTGAQGSGLVRAILADKQGGYRARVITRKPDSEKAKALGGLGAEIVSADVDDEASVRRAFDGAHGAYCVTAYWEHMDPAREFNQAGAMARAAKAAGVRHVIWSTLEDTRKWVPLSDPRIPTLMGKYKVPHFDAKGEADAHFRDSGVPTTFLLASFYWENLIFFGMNPTKGPDGVLQFTLPMGTKKLAGIGAEDIGRCAYGIFRRGDELIGKTIGIAGEHLTGAQMAESLSRALGQKVRHNDVSFDVFRSFGFPGAQDVGNMFQFYHDFEEYLSGARSREVAQSLNPSLQSFDQWLAANKDRIPLG